MRLLSFIAWVGLAMGSLVHAAALPSPGEIEAAVTRAMEKTHAKGVAIAVIENGEVRHISAHGVRNEKGEPLLRDTIMYGASLTKAVLAYVALQLVDSGKLQLDTPIVRYFDKPIYEHEFNPKYGDWRPLRDDPRWEKITPRIVLTHATGFANFAWLEADNRLRIHFDPGTRYGYSGQGIMLLQYTIEKGIGLDVGDLTRQQFDRLGMTRTSLIWRAEFAGNSADGWNEQGKVQPHEQRLRVRAAGSMDTTITDFAKFAAALVRGDGLTPKSRLDLSRPQMPITTAHQFPTFLPELPADQRRKDLAAGLGVVVFDGPQGHGFYKGGHDEGTANTMVCVEEGKRAVLILSNDVRAEAAFADLVKTVLGETGVPYDWEYGDKS